MSKACEIEKHDYDNAVRIGRCKYICPKCKKDISLILVFMHQAENYEKRN